MVIGRQLSWHRALKRGRSRVGHSKTLTVCSCGDFCGTKLRMSEFMRTLELWKCANIPAPDLLPYSWGKTSENKQNQIIVLWLQNFHKACQPEPLSHWSLQHQITWKHFHSSETRNNPQNNNSEGRIHVGFLDHLSSPTLKNETIWMTETLHRHSDSTFLCCFLAE